VELYWSSAAGLLLLLLNKNKTKQKNLTSKIKRHHKHAQQK
jgi:hypothetical protein